MQALSCKAKTQKRFVIAWVAPLVNTTKMGDGDMPSGFFQRFTPSGFD